MAFRDPKPGRPGSTKPGIVRPMSAPTQWEYPSSVLANRDADAFNEAEGLPRKAVYLSGAGKRAKIPETYSPGAIGWSERVVVTEFNAGPPPRWAHQRTTRAKVHEGKSVNTPGHGSVKLPDQASAVARAAKWDA